MRTSALLAVLVAVIASPAVAAAQDWVGTAPLGLTTMFDEGNPTTIQPFVSASVGKWMSHRWTFDSTTVVAQRFVHEGAMLTLAGEAGAQFQNGLQLFGTYELAQSGEITIKMYGGSVGFFQAATEWLPVDMRLSAGFLIATIDVDSFGDVFHSGHGLDLGVDLYWLLGMKVSVDVKANFRWIDFEIKEPVIDGDHRLGGAGVQLAVGLAWHL